MKRVLRKRDPGVTRIEPFDRPLREQRDQEGLVVVDAVFACREVAKEHGDMTHGFLG